jgi:hypothetical protein
MTSAPAPLLAELAYFPEEERQRSSMSYLGYFAPLVVAAIVAKLIHGALFFPAVVVSLIGYHRYRKRQRQTPTAVLRVRDGELHVSWPGRHVEDSVTLDELEDVVLDTKTVEYVQEATSGVPELRFINARVGPAIDIARIELETPEGSIFLTEGFVSHTDAVEWFQKVRRFLRQHGWVPMDERK